MRRQRTVDHTDPVANAPAILAALREGAVFAVIHADANRVRRGSTAAFLDFITSVTTGDRTGNRCQCTAIAVSNLVAQQAANNCTDADADAARRCSLLMRHHGFNAAATMAHSLGYLNVLGCIVIVR